MPFTPREKKVLELLFQGNTFDQIRKTLNANKESFGGYRIDEQRMQMIITRIQGKVFHYEQCFIESRKRRVRMDQDEGTDDDNQYIN